GKLRLRVVLRKRRNDRARLARLDAGELFLKARDERLRADHDLDVLGRAAFERRAVDRAGERHGDAVVDLGLAVALGDERTVLLGDAADRLVDLLIRDVSREALEL